MITSRRLASSSMPRKLMLLALAGVLTMLAFAPGAQARTTKTKVTVTASTLGQTSVLKARKVTVKVKASASGKVKVALSLRQGKKATTLTSSRTVKVKRNRTTKVTLTLTRSGRTALAKCATASVRITARLTIGRRHVSTTKSVKVALGTTCKTVLPPCCKTDPPPPAPEADPCDPIDPANCLYPFPSNFFTRPDATSPTGLRVAFPAKAMPKNKAGIQVDPTEWNRNDGFSPGASIITRIPGLDTPAAVANSHLPPVTDIGRYADADAGVVVIDTMTGDRWPVWAEIDSNAVDDAHRTLIVRPAKNFLEGHRYVVGLRNLRNADNLPIEAGAAFRAYRDGTAPDSDPRKAALESVLNTLTTAGVSRSSLYLAWDFTVASEQGLTGRALAIRDDAFHQLGDDNLADAVVPPASHAPDFTIVSDCRPGNVGDGCPAADVGRASNPKFVANVAHQIKGTYTVPCYLTTPNCATGGRFTLDAAGKPTQHGTLQARFVCNVPQSASAANKAFPTLYGHGLLGNYDEAGGSGNVWALGNENNVIVCATDWSGLAQDDVGSAVQALMDISKFPPLTDRMQQGFLNFMYLGRLLHTTALQGGIAQAAPFLDAGQPLIDTGHVAYYGNSQGGIMGGALTALSPDITRSALYVGAMNYSTLLPRSIDFDTYKPFLFVQGYPDSLEQPLILALVQMLWDRGEPNGYAHHMTRDPLPNTPEHHVLLEMALGDHQVANVAFLVEARTIGAKIRTNQTIAPERIAESGAPDLFWGVPTIDSGALPTTDNAMNVWDIGPLRPKPGDGLTGVPMPPMTNTPPSRDGQDPHDYVIENSPAIRKQISDWIRAGGQLNEAAPRILGDGCGVGTFCKLPDSIWDGTFPG